MHLFEAMYLNKVKKTRVCRLEGGQGAFLIAYREPLM
ncbi:hypothetical protein AB751O23_BZ_00040 [Chlamydiales bacterium SCGC AB-751-O23]|nr:hypothetical protein AB751O23_BZ_00040 [Chlamydiales bacterium SCGC AB-751-O23]